MVVGQDLACIAVIGAYKAGMAWYEKNIAELEKQISDDDGSAGTKNGGNPADEPEEE